MEVKIKAIHFDVSEKLVSFINKKAEKLNKHNADIADVDVSLKVIKPETACNKEVGVKVIIPSKEEFFASKVADTFEEAFDLAMEALIKQISRKKDK
ncbi:MAG: HPF/RaiA family ribosome-associated protein [Bacteroidales bacterium]